jgi:hypothetical protein
VKSRIDSGSAWYVDRRLLSDCEEPVRIGLGAVKDKFTTPEEQDQLAIFVKSVKEAYSRAYVVIQTDDLDINARHSSGNALASSSV